MQKKTIALFVLLFCLSAGFGWFLFSKTIGDTIRERSREIARQQNIGMVDFSEKPREGVVNYLLLGVDEREDDAGRSDTIIIASVNFVTKKIGLISIPRDTMTEIPLHGKQKINHAYAFGGAKLTKQVVEQETGIKINNFLIVDFKAFKNAVDIFDGVEIDVEKDMYYRDDYDGPYGFTIDLKKGKQKLDGDHALQYVRYRDEEGDIGRAKRQQKFLRSFSQRLMSRKIITDAPNILRQIVSLVKTDLSFNEMVHILRNLDANGKYEIETILLSGHPEMIDDISYWIIDKDLNHAQLVAMNNFVKDPEPPKQGKPKQPELIKDSGIDWQIAQLDKEIQENNDAREKLRREEEAERMAQIEPQKPILQPKKDGITIINTTADEEKAQTAIDALIEEGLNIGQVSMRGSGTPNGKTIFIVDSGDRKTINAIREMPFRCSTMYRKNTSKPTLIIGEDF